MAATAFVYRSRNSSSDSDSDNSDKECIDWKRASRKTEDVDLDKIPIEPPPVENSVMAPANDLAASKRKKRNNIWCDVLEDQMISETLGHCGIKNKPPGYGSRGEESYDYTLKYKFAKKGDGSRKMSEDELSDASETPSVASLKNNQSRTKFVKLDPTGAAAAKKIIATLGEQKRYLIFRVVKYIGIEKAMRLLKMTEDVEESGGMLIKNQVRRRTPGGVYFQLLKADKDVDKSAIDKIFEGEFNSWETKKLMEKRRKEKRKLLKGSQQKDLLKDMEFAQPQSKDSCAIDEDSMDTMETEELPTLLNEKVNDAPVAAAVQASKDSDLEDGEIED